MRIALFVSLFIGIHSFAQNEWKECTLEDFSNAIMEAERNLPENSSYSYESVYKFYENLTGNVPKTIEEARLIYSKGKELYLSQFGRIMVQNTVFNVVCDTAQKSIMIKEANEENFKRKNSSDFQGLLNSRCTVKRKTEAKMTKYYLEFPKGATYLAAEIWLLKGGIVDTYILYMAQEVYDDSGEEDKFIRPRMEIKYKNYQSGTNVQTAEMMRVEDFIVVTPEEVRLHPNYSEFELIDLRIPNN